MSGERVGVGGSAGDGHRRRTIGAPGCIACGEPAMCRSVEAIDVVSLLHCSTICRPAVARAQRMHISRKTFGGDGTPRANATGLEPFGLIPLSAGRPVAEARRSCGRARALNRSVKAAHLAAGRSTQTRPQPDRDAIRANLITCEGSKFCEVLQQAYRASHAPAEALLDLQVPRAAPNMNYLYVVAPNPASAIRPRPAASSSEAWKGYGAGANRR